MRPNSGLGGGNREIHATASLAEREELLELLAVESHEGMRSELEKKGLKNVTVHEGDAGMVPLEDGSVDAVIVALGAW